MKTYIARLVFMIPLIGLVALAQDAVRPPQVPPGYVITPFGYFHPSCTRFIADGETVLADGRIAHADGSVDTVAPVCDFPHYSPQGSLIAANGKPVTNGWVEYISVVTSSSYGKIATSWVTPPAPTVNNGQTLFFFPGFEDINNVQSIVQPVLQWGASSAGGGAYWALASWNCCLAGIADYSRLINASVGDTIVGSITSNCSPGSPSCATWNVVSQDKTKGTKTGLMKTISNGQIWNWAFGAVMEVYGVVQCTDYPANTGVTFTVHLYDQNVALISNPGWTKTQISGISPSCGFSLTSTATKETVGYTP